MTPAELVESLKDIPAVELELIQLAWDLLDENGQLDLDKLRFRMEDINLAEPEASAYARATYLMREALKQCMNQAP